MFSNNVTSVAFNKIPNNTAMQLVALEILNSEVSPYRSQEQSNFKSENIFYEHQHHHQYHHYHIT